MAKTELIEELPSNSKSSQIAPIRESRRRRKDVEVIESKPTRAGSLEPRARGLRKKKTLTQSIAETFVGESTQNVGAYILYEVLLPAAKETIQQMVTSGIEMFLFGEAGRGRSRERGKTTVSYGKYYKGDRDRDEDRKPRPTRGDRFDLSDIYFRHGDEADEVLSGLCDALEDYDSVTVADYFELAGIDGATWAHNKWGWDDLRKAYCTHTRNGYVIVLPPPIELD